MGKRMDKRRYHQIILNSILITLVLYMVVTGIAIIYLLTKTAPPQQITKETIVVYEEAPVNRGATEPRKPVTMETDLTQPSQMSPESLKNCLPDALSDLSHTFIQAERKTGVNALFLVSVAALESGWGESDLAKSHNNLFGWTDSKSKSGFMYFESKNDSIMYVANKLKENYLSPDGVYFNGHTARDINVKYCTSDDWYKKVITIMKKLEEKYNETIHK